MSDLEPSFVGKYVGGRYHVQAGASLFEAGVIAAHEEAHGILRRSSAYGAILTTARRALAASLGDGGAFALHVLASRSRTSEEVHATYQSYRTAASWPGRQEALQKIRERYPTYQLYFDIGEELVGREPVAPLANAALDAIIRFCWSAKPLAEIEIPVRNLANLRKIPSASSPDARLRSFRRAWTEESLREFMDAMMGKRQSALRKLLGKPPQELYDPFASALQSLMPLGAAFIGSADFDRQLYQERAKLALLIAQIEESLVQDGYVYLAEKHAGTALEALDFDELTGYVMRVMESDRRSAEVPEVTILRSRPVQVRLVDERQSRRGERLVFLRARESFDAQFEVVEPTVPQGDGPAVVYSVEAVHPGDVPVDHVLSLGMETVDFSRLAVAVRNLWGRPGLVAVFASVVAQAPSDIWREVEALHALGGRIWLVCDLAPRECVRMVKSRMPEARAFWHGPTHPNVGGLIVPQVGDGGPVQGVVYMGSRVSMEGLLRGILIDELGDDLRGFGPALHVYEESYRREKEGQLLGHWLLSIERFLS